MSDWEVVDRAELNKIKGRPKHSETYDRWFSKVLTLKENEMLKINLGKKSATPMPSPPAVRFAVERWNKEYPDKKIGQTLKDGRSDNPIVFLYRLKEGEKVRFKKHKKV
jgi:hypothetical protein